MARTLVVAPNWIGDALMAQPLLSRLREKSSIDVLAPEWVAPVVRRMPEVDEVITAPFRHGALQLGERWKLGRALGRRGYGQAIVLPNTWKSALVPFFARIPLRSGYVGEARYGLLNRLHRSTGAPLREHYAALADARTDLPLTFLRKDTQEIEKTRQRFAIPARYAVFCPGAEYGPAKRWPFFAELSNAMKIPVVLLGSGEDAAAAQGITAKNLVGKTTLDEAIELIAGAEFVVSNDSGLMHVAAALGRPQVALFGSSSPLQTPPQPPASRVLWLHLECSPCFQRECPLGHFRCMRDLSVERVLSEIEKLEH